MIQTRAVGFQKEAVIAVQEVGLVELVVVVLQEAFVLLVAVVPADNFLPRREAVVAGIVLLGRAFGLQAVENPYIVQDCFDSMRCILQGFGIHPDPVDPAVLSAGLYPLHQVFLLLVAVPLGPFFQSTAAFDHQILVSA